MVESGGSKRGCEEGGEDGSSPEAKRFRDELLCSILDGDDDASGSGDDDASGSDVASVMKSLEEEISLHSAPVRGFVPPDQPDLGYLLEASDDDLGLPPAASSSSGEERDASEEGIAVGDGREVDGVAFGQIWEFSDEMDGYSGLGCGIQPEDRVEAAAEGLVYDAGLFNYAEELYAPSDLAEFSWQW